MKGINDVKINTLLLRVLKVCTVYDGALAECLEMWLHRGLLKTNFIIDCISLFPPNLSSDGFHGIMVVLEAIFKRPEIWTNYIDEKFLLRVVPALVGALETIQDSGEDQVHHFCFNALMDVFESFSQAYCRFGLFVESNTSVGGNDDENLATRAAAAAAALTTHSKQPDPLKSLLFSKKFLDNHKLVQTLLSCDPTTMMGDAGQSSAIPLLFTFLQTLTRADQMIYLDKLLKWGLRGLVNRIISKDVLDGLKPLPWGIKPLPLELFMRFASAEQLVLRFPNSNLFTILHTYFEVDLNFRNNFLPVLSSLMLNLITQFAHTRNNNNNGNDNDNNNNDNNNPPNLLHYNQVLQQFALSPWPQTLSIKTKNGFAGSLDPTSIVQILGRYCLALMGPPSSRSISIYHPDLPTTTLIPLIYWCTDLQSIIAQSTTISENNYASTHNVEFPSLHQFLTFIPQPTPQNPLPPISTPNLPLSVYDPRAKGWIWSHLLGKYSNQEIKRGSGVDEAKFDENDCWWFSDPTKSPFPSISKTPDPICVTNEFAYFPEKREAQSMRRPEANANTTPTIFKVPIQRYRYLKEQALWNAAKSWVECNFGTGTVGESPLFNQPRGGDSQPSSSNPDLDPSPSTPPPSSSPSTSPPLDPQSLLQSSSLSTSLSSSSSASSTTTTTTTDPSEKTIIPPFVAPKPFGSSTPNDLYLQLNRKRKKLPPPKVD